MDGSERPAAPRGGRGPLAWGLAAVLAVVLAVVGVRALLGGFGAVQGSTDAWLLAQVHRALHCGDYTAAAGVSVVPNTTWNSLYPALVTALAALSGLAPVVVGQLLSAGALGLAAVALARCWHAAAGPAVAVVAGAALLFPPALLAASMARYDMLAIALVLGVGWAVVAALTRGSLLAWGLAGLLAGLAYHAREMMLAPALGGVLVGVALHLASLWPLGALRRRHLRRLAPLGAVLLGLLLGLLPLPLLLGLDPRSGLQALSAYAERGRPGMALSLVQVLSLDRLGWAFGLGALGLLVAAVRPGPTGRRQGALVLLGLLLPFGAFLLSRQQSPQYYLLPQVLLLSGLVGLVGRLPGRWPRHGALALLGVVTLAWGLRDGRALLDGRLDTDPGWHSEAWPADRGEVSEVMGWALAGAEDQAVIVMSATIENIDALASLEHDRPVAFLHPEDLGRLGEAAALGDGRPLRVLTVESLHATFVRVPGAQLLERHDSAHLRAAIWVLPAALPPPTAPGEPLCARGVGIRGACLQHAWVDGGDAALCERTLAVHRWYRGLQSYRSMWW